MKVGDRLYSQDGNSIYKVDNIYYFDDHHGYVIEISIVDGIHRDVPHCLTLNIDKNGLSYRSWLYTEQ